MGISSEGKIGIGLALIGVLGGASVTVLPAAAKPIGWISIVGALVGLMLLFAHHVRDQWHNPPPTGVRWSVHPYVAWPVGMLFGAAVGIGVEAQLGLWAPDPKQAEINPKLIVVSGQIFTNSEVVLDDHEYIGCTFINVRLVYGGAPFKLERNNFNDSVVVTPVGQALIRYTKLLQETGNLRRPVLDSFGIEPTTSRWTLANGSVADTPPQ